MSQTSESRSSPVLARTAILLVRVLGWLPLAWLRRLARAVALLVVRLPNRYRAISDLNLRMAFPDLPSAERRTLLRRSLQETVVTVFEQAAVWQAPLEELRRLETEAEGEELLEASRSQGDGTLLLLPHLGNWEMLSPLLNRRGTAVGVYRRPRIREVDGFLREARERFGLHMVPASPAGLRPLVRALRDNEMAIILPDQEPPRGHGVHAPFFGVPAYTMTFVSRVLRLTGAVPLFVCCLRQPSGGFRLHFLPAPPGLADPDPESAAASLNRGVENCVALSPEQYLWAYKRFSTPPAGLVSPYREL